MHLFGGIGFFMLFVSFLVNGYLFILKLFGEDIGSRPLLTLGVMLFIGGIQLISTGFLAELMMRTYYESQNKKPYVVKEVFVGKD